MLSNDKQVIKQYKQTIQEEFLKVSEAYKMQDTNAITTHLLTALKLSKELHKLTNDNQSKNLVAEIYYKIAQLQKLNIPKLNELKAKQSSTKIWLDLFNDTYLAKYRKSLELVGYFEKDETDYSQKANLLYREVDELKKYSTYLGRYDIYQDDEENIVIHLPKVMNGDNEDITLFCDGGRHAILFKGPYRLIICEDIHEDIRHAFKEGAKIIFEEPSKEVYSPTVIYDEITTVTAEEILSLIMED